MRDATQDSGWGFKKKKLPPQITFEELTRLRRRIEKLMLRHPELVLKIARVLRLN